MKHVLMAAAVAFSLSACSDSNEQPAGHAGGGAAAVPAVAFSKAGAIRPASLPAELAPVSSCAFDRLNGGEHGASSAIADKSRVAINGWAADTKATAAPGPVFVEFDGPVKLYVAAQRSLKRPDVAGAFNNPVLQDAGWEANVDLSAATPGEYKLRVIEVNGAAGTICDPHGALVIAG